jgi:two-component system, LuxR family, sensor kinase FixL
MGAATCLTLAAVHLLVWVRDRSARGSLWFALAAGSIAWLAACELRLMHSQSGEQFLYWQRLGHAAVFVTVVSLVLFVLDYLKSGRVWLAWTVIGLRAATLLITYISPTGLNYSQILGIRRIEFLGEEISVLRGVASGWTRFGEFTLVLLVAFVIDAAVTAWRRGDRRGRQRALVVGASVACMVLISVTCGALLHRGILQMPYIISWTFLLIVAAMGSELSFDMIQAGKLARELRESEQRLDLATRAADLGVWLWDLERDEVWGSATFRAMFGMDRSSRIDSGQLFARLHPDDAPAVREAIDESLRSEGEYNAEYRVIHADGSERWIAARGRAEPAARGRSRMMLGVVHDVTRQRNADEEMRQMRQALTHANRVATVGQLASALAHELNQPLGAILRNAEAAELLLAESSPDVEELRAIVADIIQDDHRAGDVIDRLRAMLRKRPVEFRALDVRALVEDVLQLLRSEAQARRIRIESMLPEDLPPISGDRVQLQQVLINLIVNAMDAVNASTIEPRRYVRLRARVRPDGVVEIAVCDGGPGIPAGLADKLFEPFFTTKPQGLGMGLPVSRGIIAGHGGQLWVENDVEGGAVFRITLRQAEKQVDRCTTPLSAFTSSMTTSPS